MKAWQVWFAVSVVGFVLALKQYESNLTQTFTSVIKVPCPHPNESALLAAAVHVAAPAALAAAPAVAAAPLTSAPPNLIYSRYIPSKLETWWVANGAHMLQDWNSGCTKVKEAVPTFGDWFKLAVGAPLDKGNYEGEQDVLSLHEYIVEGTNQVVRVPIEPLMGLLRHPNALCIYEGEDGVFRKDYMILPARSWPTHANATRILVFDLGASLYSSGGGGASQEWIVNEMKKRGLIVDRYFAWEASPLAPNDVFSSYPKEFLHKISYYNVGVQPGADDMHNPARVLKQTAVKDDFVIFKLDIDTPPLEQSLVRQLMADAEARDLIDEFFYEEHTVGTPMTQYWGDGGKGFGVAQSYQSFSKLRHFGLRAHSWV